MNSSLVTQASSSTIPNCPEDCYTLELMKETSGPAIIISRLSLSCMLVIFAGLTLLVTRRTSRLKQRPSTTLLTNLGITGVLIGVIILVFTIAHIALKFRDISRTSLIICLLVPRVLHIVTTLLLTSLTLDRYLALCMPLRYPSLLTDTRCSKLAIICWVIPIVVLGLAYLCGGIFNPCSDIRPYLATYLIIFGFAIIAIVVMHVLIAVEFRRQDDGVCSEEMVTVRRRTAKELMMVVMLNLLLATPDMGMKIYLLNCPKTLHIMFHVAPSLLLLHLVCFYPLYTWKNMDFRMGLLDIFTAIKLFFVRMLTKCSPIFYGATPLSRQSFKNLSNTSSTIITTATCAATAVASTAPTVTTATADTATTITISSSLRRYNIGSFA